MHPGFTPRIDGFQGVPIGAIYAANQNPPVRIPTGTPAPPPRVDPAVEAARRDAEAEIAATDDPITRLVRALVHDYEVVEVPLESSTKWIARRNQARFVNLDPQLRVPDDLWIRLYKTTHSNVACLDVDQTYEVAEWFAFEATERGLEADTATAWPVKPRKSLFGKVLSETGEKWGPIWYETGDVTEVFFVSQHLRAHDLRQPLGKDFIIAADGTLHIPEDINYGEIITPPLFDMVTLIWFGYVLGMPVSDETADVLDELAQM